MSGWRRALIGNGPVAGQDCGPCRVPGIYDGVQILGGLLIEFLKGEVIEDEKIGPDERPQLLVESVNEIGLGEETEECPGS